jgi:predicted aspartyl protease
MHSFPKPGAINFVLCFAIGMVGGNILAPAIAQDPSLTMAIKQYERQDYNTALIAFKQVRAKEAQPTALYYEALCLQHLGNQSKAIEIYRQIVVNYSATKEAQLATGYLQQLSGQSAVLTYSQQQTANGASSANVNPSSIQNEIANARVTEHNSTSYDHLPDTATVPFSRGVNNHIFVNALINGRPMKVMFDTGAASCFFGRSELNNAGVSYVPTGETAAVRGVGSQTVRCDQADLEITLGDITRKTTCLIAVPSAHTEPLIGQTFFKDFRYDIDTTAGVIHFRKKGSRNREAYDTINIPFTEAGNNIVVTAKVNGIECPMFFDTGAFGNLFSFGVWRQMGLSIPSDAEMVVTKGVGGFARGYRFKVGRIELGSIIKTNVEVVVSQSAPPIPLLGQTFFKDKQFSIDNENHVIRFVH